MIFLLNLVLETKESVLNMQNEGVPIPAPSTICEPIDENDTKRAPLNQNFRQLKANF